MSTEAFVTLATNDGYALGALVLAQSIRQVGTKRNLVVLISNHLSDLIRQTLETNFDEIIVVEELNSNDNEHLRLLSRPELGITFTKINCWLLEKYSKCVFLDADCVVLREIDDLFEREEFSAAPDAGWPDCFNSGVFVYRPSKDTFTKLMQFASQQDASFDGGDQGLLNRFFSNWSSTDISRHLPFTYNVTANAFYSYLPAVTRFRNDIHIVHFAGALKPWQLTYNPQNEQLSGNLNEQNDIQRDFLLSWWRIMYQHVWPQLSKLNKQSNLNNQSIGEEGQFGGLLNYGNLTTNTGIEVGSAEHRRAWESGHIDYYGRDSFSNIQQQLERNIAQHPQQYHPSQQRQTTPEKTTTSILKNSNKETTPPPLQTTNLSKTVLKETAPPPLQTTNLSKTVLKETTPPPPLQTTNLPKSILKETITSQQTNSLHENIQSLSGSTLPTNNNNSTNEQHETSWTVKSTILTAYTQGVGELTGPTVLSKVVSESSATSSNNVPITTSIKQKPDLTGSSGSNVTVKTPNHHFAWLFDKLFVAIMYTISLCYLVFLVVIRRSKNAHIIHGNETSIRGVTSSTTATNNGNRVKK